MIETKLKEDIKKYCELNSLNMKVYVNNLLKKAFMIDKYGEKPPIHSSAEVEKNKEYFNKEEENKTTERVRHKPIKKEVEKGRDEELPKKENEKIVKEIEEVPRNAEPKTHKRKLQ